MWRHAVKRYTPTLHGSLVLTFQLLRSAHFAKHCSLQDVLNRCSHSAEDFGGGGGGVPVEAPPLLGDQLVDHARCVALRSFGDWIELKPPASRVIWIDLDVPSASHTRRLHLRFVGGDVGKERYPAGRTLSQWAGIISSTTIIL